jgi:sugar diacid utilization regulator
MLDPAMTPHASIRASQRKITPKQITTALESGYNYYDTNTGRLIKYYDGAGMVIENGRVVTVTDIIYKKWKRYDERPY